jgi:protocatechuate 3,4-dioxygenase beta subunit
VYAERFTRAAFFSLKDELSMKCNRRYFAIAVGAAFTLGPLLLARAASAASLSPTPEQVEGPYFLTYAPVTGNLIPAGMAGEPIEVTGRVLDTSGKPVANAIVHVWVADPKGVYDNQDATGAVVKIPFSKMTLRGRIFTDATGSYSFKCLRPGNYALGNGQMRPAHIHVKVEASAHKTLITQLYFTDDKFNVHDLPGPGFFQKELLVYLTPAKAAAGVVQKGTFDFVLR